MPITKSTAFTIDGKSRFKIGDDVYSWATDKIDFVNVISKENNKDISVTISLAGDGWRVGTLKVDGTANIKTIIKDSATDGFRKIDQLNLWGEAGSVVSLKSTHINYIETGDANDTISTGIGGVDMIFVRNGHNEVNVGGGRVRSIVAMDGNDEVNLSTGKVDSINLGEGKDVVNGGREWTGSVDMGAGNDIVNVGDGDMDMIRLGAGDNIVNLKGSGRVNAIMGYDGVDTVKITGKGEVDMIQLARGDNFCTTGVGVITAISSFAGNQTINVGSGGVGTLRLSYGDNKIVAEGHVGAVVATDGDNDFVFNGNVGAIEIGAGANKMVFRGTYVDSIATSHDGDDVVTLHKTNAVQIYLDDGDDTIYGGSGRIGQGQMGQGNDIVYFSDLKINSNVSSFNGGSGTETRSGEDYIDTISFEKFTSRGVSISLGIDGRQDTGSGFIVLSGFEALAGTKLADTLSGDRSNNSLTGGLGADTFVFYKGGDQDTITDFNKSQNDKIDLSGMTTVDDFSDLRGLISQVGRDTVIDFGDDTLTLKNFAKGDLASGDFTF